MKQLLSLFIATLLVLQAWSQNNPQGLIKGRILDKETKNLLSGTTVALLRARDSSSAGITFSDKNGTFVFENVRDGSYKLYITYLGYESMLQAVLVSPEDRQVDVGDLTLHRNGLTLAEVEIVDTRSYMKVKKDTLEFKAAYFKTRQNAVVEELLKRLPGVQVDRDGTIRVNGEIVRYIMVDGRPFFINDPKLATKNLLAEMIDKVQLIDKKTDQAIFSGIDDGKREKVINITIKKDQKESIIGQVSAGYGTNDRFSANVSLNRFRDAQQLSLVANGNNLNGYEEGRIGAGSGIIRNWKGGINYSDEWGKKIKVSGNYMLDDTKTDNHRIIARQNLLPDTSYYYNQDAITIEKNTSHSVNFRLVYNPDSMNELTLDTRASYNISRTLQESSYSSLNESKTPVNNGRIFNSGTNTAPGWATDLTWARRFKRPGHTLKVSATIVRNEGRQDGINESMNTYAIPGRNPFKDSINQKNDISVGNDLLQLFATYTIPTFKDHSLSVTYGISREGNNSNKNTFDFNPLKKVYDSLNDSFSNSFDNVSYHHFTSIMLNGHRSGVDYFIGLNRLTSDITYTNSFQKEAIKLHVFNFLPVASFNYGFKENSRLYFNYNAGYILPTPLQLQPIPDNSNPLYIPKGNPDLKPGRTDNFQLQYNSFNVTSQRSFAISMTAALSHNKIVNATSLDTLGRQISMPMNMDGAYVLGLNIANGFPVKKQRTTINTNTGLTYTRDVNFNNGIRGVTSNLAVTQNVNYSYTHKELFDFSASAGVNYNMVKYSVQKDLNTNYFDYNFSFNGNLNLPLGFIIGVNVNYLLNTGRAAGYNLDMLMLNASLSKTVFKEKQGLFKIQGFDLLNRNVSISRNVGDTYIEDVQNKVLQRFFMASFTYFLKKRSSK